MFCKCLAPLDEEESAWYWGRDSGPGWVSARLCPWVTLGTPLSRKTKIPGLHDGPGAL